MRGFILYVQNGLARNVHNINRRNVVEYQVRSTDRNFEAFGFRAKRSTGCTIPDDVHYALLFLAP